jgi:hypothetical protein
MKRKLRSDMAAISITLLLILGGCDLFSGLFEIVNSDDEDPPPAAWTDLSYAYSPQAAANYNVDLVSGPTGTVYAIYMENDAPNQLKVLKIQGTIGTEIGSGFGAGGTANNYGAIALDPSGTPVIMSMVAVTEGETTTRYPMVSRYSGTGTTWNEVQFDELMQVIKDSGVTIQSPFASIAVDSRGYVYLVLQTWSSTSGKNNKAIALMHDGAHWFSIGILPDDVNVDASAAGNFSLKIGNDDTVYLGLSRQVSTVRLNYVYEYSGSGTAWNLVGGAEIDPNHTNGLDIAVDGSAIQAFSMKYVSGESFLSVWEPIVYTFDGDSWNQLGDALDSSAVGGRVFPNGDEPIYYYMKKVDSNFLFFFKKWNGSSWSEAALPLDGTPTLSNCRATISVGYLYASFAHFDLSANRYFIKRYPLN